jgi:hypothetical protein
MASSAYIIYANPTPEVAAALAREPFLRQRMFLIDNLEGIRYAGSRELILSDSPPPDRAHGRHGLPPGGLLAICYDLADTSGCDRDDPPSLEFRETFYEYNGPWQIESATSFQPLTPLPDNPYGIGFSRLLGFLRSVATETRSPIVYYGADMHGRTMCSEEGWAFDEADHRYEFVDDHTVLHETANGRCLVHDRQVLQLLMAHLRLALPTGFFALHEWTFDWSRYWLHAAGES